MKDTCEEMDLELLRFETEPVLRDSAENDSLQLG